MSNIFSPGLRDYQDSKADVIQKYNPDEARNLKAYKELPETAKINDAQINEDDDLDGIEFQVMCYYREFPYLLRVVPDQTITSTPISKLE